MRGTGPDQLASTVGGGNRAAAHSRRGAARRQTNLGHHAWRNCFLASNRLDAPARLRNWLDGTSVEVGIEALP
jgi:hypothetical protein